MFTYGSFPPARLPMIPQKNGGGNGVAARMFNSIPESSCGGFFPDVNHSKAACKALSFCAIFDDDDGYSYGVGDEWCSVQGNYGNGNQGIVVAIKSESEKRYAVKHFSSISACKREYMIQSALKHPGICGCYAMDVDEGILDPCLLLEAVHDAKSLADVILENNGGLDVKQASKYIKQLCDAVRYCHVNGVVHRDIKPENILVDRNGNIKLIDFGSSEKISRDKSARFITSGTLLYKPTEELSADKRDFTKKDGVRSDAYAVALISVQLLTGKLPGKLDSFGDTQDLADLIQEKKQAATYVLPVQGDPRIMATLKAMLVSGSKISLYDLVKALPS